MTTRRQGLRAQRSALEMATVALASRLPNHAVRVATLRAWGARLGDDVTVYHGLQVRDARRLVIGDRTSVGDGVVLDARGGLTLGSDVNLSTGVAIWTAQHDIHAPDFAYQAAPVTVGDHAWISTRAIVLAGRTVGEGAVVAAGAVVARDVQPYDIVAGVPAVVVGRRSGPMDYRLPGARDKVWWW